MLRNLNINLDGWRPIYSFLLLFEFDIFLSWTLFIAFLAALCNHSNIKETSYFSAQCCLTVWTSHPTTRVVQPVCHFPDHCIAPSLWLVYHLPTTPLSLICTIYPHLPVQLFSLDCLIPKMGALWFCKMPVKIYRQHDITLQKS